MSEIPRVNIFFDHLGFPRSRGSYSIVCCVGFLLRLILLCIVAKFSAFSVVLLVLGRPERSSSSADTRPALKRECHSKTAVRLKDVLQKPHEAFQGFR
jgi:hypothetical protein